MPELFHLKIEGRLKDVSYVKNVTAAYRQKLDAIFALVRNMYVLLRVHVVSNLNHNSIRVSVVGFTHYFLNGRDKEIFSFDTPKSLGEEMGTMKEARGNYLTVAGLKSFNNGDGVCYNRTNRDVCRVSVSTGWTVTNSIRRKCPVLSRVLHCIVISTRNLNECFPVSLPKGKSQCECCLPTIIPVSL